MPRPVHRPVDIWQPIVCGNQRGLDFMARPGIKGLMLGPATEFIDVWVQL